MMGTQKSPSVHPKDFKRKYSNLSFLACQKTLQRLKLEHGIDAPLLPEVLVVPSALDEIVNRLEKGWSYIQA